MDPLYQDSVILSLDPGGTTGYAIMDNGEIIAEGELRNKLSLGHEALHNFINKLNPDMVVCEDFNYRPYQTHAELISLEYIGVAKLWCQIMGVGIIMQKSALGKVTGKKVFWNPEKIKRVGLWRPGMPHAMDAVGHLLYFWTFTLGQSDYVDKLEKLGDFSG